MLRIAVCDDEERFCGELSGRLSAILSGVGEAHRIFPFTDAQALAQAGDVFDILLLDIRLPGMSGLELARSLRAGRQGGEIIFITAYPDYVFEAFPLEAVDYLCKPVEEERLRQALLRAAGRARVRERESFLLKARGISRRIALQDICYCEVFGRQLCLHTVQERICFPGRLSSLQPQLDERFFCCHRSYLLNLDYLRGLSGGQALLEGGGHIPVSRLRQAALHEALLRRLSGRAAQ